MQVFDDFLDERDASRLEALITGYDFQWYFLNFGTCSKEDMARRPEYAEHDRPQFTHMLWHYKRPNISSYYGDTTVLIDRLEEKTGRSFAKRLVRMKANLVMQDKNAAADAHHFPHQDLGTPAETLLYYVNDADGDTFVFNEHELSGGLTRQHRISPRRNRAVLFNSDQMHAGSSPRYAKYRAVVNVLFERAAA
jgi:hypothetical protein